MYMYTTVALRQVRITSCTVSRDIDQPLRYFAPRERPGRDTSPLL